MFSIRKSTARVAEFETLVWDVFFKSRNRGLSLIRHFPWLASEHNLAYYMVVEIDGQVVGGLVVKKRLGCIHGHSVNIGLIGLVCITPAFRGRGLGTILMNKTLKQTASDDFDLLTLWAGDASLYRKHQFVSSDIWTFGWVCENTVLTPKTGINPSMKLVELPDASIPPFALSTHEIVYANSKVSLVLDATGPIVTGYTGDARGTALVMKKAFFGNWRINLEKGDVLLSELNYLGYKVNLSPVNLQMWHRVNSSYPVSVLSENLRIPVLERI